MAEWKEKAKHKYTPGCDDSGEEIFDFPFVSNDETMEYIKKHGRLVFIVRGPPGTGKGTLSSILCDRYPNSVVCCADRYFTNSFTSPERNKESLIKSHEYCHKKVKDACMKGRHPIIVQNTHIRKHEMQEYINYAAEYNYTVVMAITLRKFDVTPEVLAKSNKKGLTKSYFTVRLRQWEETYPIYTGWFICPDDASYFLGQMQNSLEALLGDGRFCRVFDIYDKDGLQKHYKAKRMLFCKAADLKNRNHRMKQYYLSEKVLDCYGKMFVITVVGYIVNEREITALVQTDVQMRDVIIQKTKKVTLEDDMDNISGCLQSLSLDRNSLEHNKLIDFNQNFLDSGKTVELSDWAENDSINVENCAFIILAHNHQNIIDVSQVENNCKSVLLENADPEGNIKNTNFIELDDDVKILRLSDSTWLIKAPKKISMKSIFTGLYI